MEPHHEASPLLGEKGKRNVTEVPTVENNRMWKFALVAVGLSALGLIATSTSMGGNFHITSFDSANIRGSTPTNTPPVVANAPPLLSGTPGSVPVAGGPLSATVEIPSDTTDVSARVPATKENTKAATASTSSSSAKSAPLQSTGKLMTSSSPAVMPEGADTTSASSTESTDAASTVILPGSPNDPQLALERAKKVQAEEIVEIEVEEATAAQQAAAAEAAAAAAAEAAAAAAHAQEAKEQKKVETTTETTEEATSSTDEKTGGKHGSKAVVDIPEKSTEEKVTNVEEEETTATAVSAVPTSEAEVTMPKYIPTAIASTDTSSNGHGIDEKIVPESLSYEFVYNKMAPNNFPFLMHYRYADNSCTNMVAAEGFSLDVCFASKVNGKSFFQKNVAWVTTYDTGMFTYYYTDNECTNLVTDVNEVKENPSVLQYRTDCYTADDASPGKAAIVSTTDVRTLQYEKLGLPATSSVVVGNYGNDQCLVPTTFTWQRTDVCYNDEMYKCDGSLGHKTSYSMGTKCSGSFKGTDLPFKIAECLDTASYGLVSGNNFQMSNCWEVAPIADQPVTDNVVVVEDVVATVETEETTTTTTTDKKPWWKFWA